MNNSNIELSDKFNKENRKSNMLLLLIGVCLTLVAAIAYTIPMIGNPMRRPNPMPTNYVLNLTPIGTHIDDVIRIVENHREDWRIERINLEEGFMHPSSYFLRPRPEVWPFIVGDKSIRVRAEPYRPVGLLTRTVVAIHYGFDTNGYLIEVYVFRSSSS